jgi:hypothetical protein
VAAAETAAVFIIRFCSYGSTECRHAFKTACFVPSITTRREGVVDLLRTALLNIDSTAFMDRIGGPRIMSVLVLALTAIVRGNTHLARRVVDAPTSLNHFCGPDVLLLMLKSTAMSAAAAAAAAVAVSVSDTDAVVEVGTEYSVADLDAGPSTSTSLTRQRQLHASCINLVLALCWRNADVILACLRTFVTVILSPAPCMGGYDTLTRQMALRIAYHIVCTNDVIEYGVQTGSELDIRIACGRLTWTRIVREHTDALLSALDHVAYFSEAFCHYTTSESMFRAVSGLLLAAGRTAIQPEAAISVAIQPLVLLDVEAPFTASGEICGICHVGDGDVEHDAGEDNATVLRVPCCSKLMHATCFAQAMVRASETCPFCRSTVLATVTKQWHVSSA